MVTEPVFTVNVTVAEPPAELDIVTMQVPAFCGVTRSAKVLPEPLGGAKSRPCQETSKVHGSLKPLVSPVVRTYTAQYIRPFRYEPVERAISRFTSRACISRRRSHSFLPRTSASSIFTRPFLK
jgi:hypothetical protein